MQNSKCKRLVLLLLLSTVIGHLSSTAQNRLLEAEKVSAKDSLKLGNKWITGINEDTTLANVTGKKIPTDEVVKKYVQSIKDSLRYGVDSVWAEGQTLHIRFKDGTTVDEFIDIGAVVYSVTGTAVTGDPYNPVINLPTNLSEFGDADIMNYDGGYFYPSSAAGGGGKIYYDSTKSMLFRFDATDTDITGDILFPGDATNITPSKLYVLKRLDNNSSHIVEVVLENSYPFTNLVYLDGAASSVFLEPGETKMLWYNGKDSLFTVSGGTGGGSIDTTFIATRVAENRTAIAANTSALSNKVDKNSSITGATKAKITYDNKGLVTAGADLTAGDIPNIAESQVTGLVSDLAGKANRDTTNARLDSLRRGQNNYAVAAGTNTYTASFLRPFNALYTGMTLRVKFTNANTAVSTLNVDGLGAVSIRKSAGDTLFNGDIVAGTIYTLTYDGTYWQANIGKVGYWYDWVVPWGGFLVDPTVLSSRYMVIGKTCWFNIVTSNPGTSNATTLTFTAPFAPAYDTKITCQAYDGGNFQTSAGIVRAFQGNNIFSAYKNMAQAAWTGSGGKTINISGTYEIQ